MTQQNLRELAKQGDPNVIASVINRTLQPKGINAQVARDNDCLQVMLESDQVPSQPALMDFIRKGMLNLGVESIHIVKVYGRQVGEDLPAWEDEIELMPADPMFYADEGAMAKKPVDSADREAENYDREEEYDPDDEAEEEEEEVEETPSQKKKIPKAAIIAGAVFVPLAAIAGLFFTGNLPFLNSSAPAPVTPSPVPSSKAASPKPKPAASPVAAAVPNTTKVTAPAPVATASPKAAAPAPVATASPKAATPAPVATASPKAATPAPVATASPKAATPAPAATASPKAATPAPAATASPKAATPAPAATASPKAATPAPAATASPKAATPAPAATASPKPAVSPKPKPAAPKPDSWRAGVNKAQSAANLAQTAISKGEWDEVASEWQKAVQLMKAVPPSSPNYEKAQQKAAEYQSNLATAQRRAAAAE